MVTKQIKLVSPASHVASGAVRLEMFLGQSERVNFIVVRINLKKFKTIFDILLN